VWYNGRTKELSHGGALGLDRDGPIDVTHHWLTVDQTLDVMLDRGEIDACTAIRPDARVTAGDPTVVDRWGGTPIDGNPRLRKLLDDDGKRVVYEFYRQAPGLGPPGGDRSRRLGARGEARSQDGSPAGSARGRKRGRPPETHGPARGGHPGALAHLVSGAGGRSSRGGDRGLPELQPVAGRHLAASQGPAALGVRAAPTDHV